LSSLFQSDDVISAPLGRSAEKDGGTAAPLSMRAQFSVHLFLSEGVNTVSPLGLSSEAAISIVWTMKVARNLSRAFRVGGGQQPCLAGQVHFSLDPLHHTDANTYLGGDLADALAAVSKGRADITLFGALGASQGLALGLGASEAGIDALADHAAFEFGEDATHLEHGTAGRGGGVERLLMQVEITADGLQFGHEGHQVLEAAPQAINRPRHDHIVFPSGGALAQGIEGRPLVPPLGAADAVVDVACHDLPAHPAGDGFQLTHLVVGGLPIGGDTGVNSNALRHGSLHRASTVADGTASVYGKQVFSVHTNPAAGSREKARVAVVNSAGDFRTPVFRAEAGIRVAPTETTDAVRHRINLLSGGKSGAPPASLSEVSRPPEDTAETVSHSGVRGLVGAPVAIVPLGGSGCTADVERLHRPSAPGRPATALPPRPCPILNTIEGGGYPPKPNRAPLRGAWIKGGQNFQMISPFTSSSRAWAGSGNRGLGKYGPAFRPLQHQLGERQ